MKYDKSYSDLEDGEGFGCEAAPSPEAAGYFKRLERIEEKKRAKREKVKYQKNNRNLWLGTSLGGLGFTGFYSGLNGSELLSQLKDLTNGVYTLYLDGISNFTDGTSPFEKSHDQLIAVAGLTALLMISSLYQINSGKRKNWKEK